MKSGNFWIRGNRENGEREVWIGGFLSKKQAFKNGKWDGIWEHYHYQSKKLAVRETWKNGFLNGDFEEYDLDSGFLVCRGKYENGQRAGYWEYFDKNNNIKKKATYLIGKLIREEYC